MIAEAFATLFSAVSLSGTHPRDPAIAKMLGFGGKSTAGVPVTYEKVMALPAIKRAVQIITDKIFGLPWYVYQEDKSGRVYDREHPAWNCVHWMANPILSAPACRQILTQWAMTHGNGCAWIDRSGSQWQLFPLNPNETKPIILGQREAEMLQNSSLNGTFRIGTKIGNEKKLLDPMDVYHIKGYGLNPYWGADITDLMAETFGEAIAKNQFSSRFFGQGANPVGFITMDGSLAEEDEEVYMKSLRGAMEGLGNAHKVILLEDGAKFTPITVDPIKSQMLEGRQFDIRQLAMAIGIKPHKLIDSANTAFASLEQANSEHRDDDIKPWIDKHNAEGDRKLLIGDEGSSGSRCIGCDDESLIYIPYTERQAGAVNLANNGIITRDEGRDTLGYSPSGTARGTQYRIPANIMYETDAATITTPADGNNQPADTKPADTKPSSLDHSDVVQAYLDRIEKRLTAQAKDKAKNIKGFFEWLDCLKAEEGPASIQPQIDDLYKVTIAKLNSLAETAKTSEELQNAI